MNTLMNFHIPQNARNSFTSRGLCFVELHRPTCTSGAGISSRLRADQSTNRNRFPAGAGDFPFSKGSGPSEVTRILPNVQYAAGAFTSG